MLFNQYVKRLKDKSEAEKQAILKYVTDKTETISDVAYACQEGVLCGRVVNNHKYAIYNRKYLDLTVLAKYLKALYKKNGYDGVGFSRLSDAELLKYTTTKIIIKNLCKTSLTDEVDVKYAAEEIFANEYKDFEWKPNKDFLL